MDKENKIELDLVFNQDIPVAKLVIDPISKTNISLKYEESWIANKNAFPISPNLPLNGNFNEVAIRNFFDNLTPEGEALEAITTTERISRYNKALLCHIIGWDLAGAISFKGRPDPKSTTFNPSISDLDRRISIKRDVGAEIVYWNGIPRTTTTGYQEKLSLRVCPSGLMNCSGDASTHILKIESPRFKHVAINEVFTMKLANAIGIDVPKVEFVVMGQHRGILVERFDRCISKGKVSKFHIIDGCQALNLPSEYKYERQHGEGRDVEKIRDGASLPKLFKIPTKNPVDYKKKLIQWIGFNLAVNNFDAHGKNISFFVLPKGELELAPFYDIVNIEACNKVTDNEDMQARDKKSVSESYAMSIGDFGPNEKGNFKAPFTAFNFVDLCEEIGVDVSVFEKVAQDLIKEINSKIQIVADECIELTGVSLDEASHVELCKEITLKSCKELSKEIEQLLEVSDML